MSVAPGTTLYTLRAPASLPVLQLTHLPLTPPSLPSPPAFLCQALLAAAQLRSRAVWPHPGLRHRLLYKGRRPCCFTPQGSRSPPGTEEEPTAAGLRVIHTTRMTAAAGTAASAAVSIPATPTSGSKNYNSHIPFQRPGRSRHALFYPIRGRARSGLQILAACL